MVSTGCLSAWFTFIYRIARLHAVVRTESSRFAYSTRLAVSLFGSALLPSPYVLIIAQGFQVVNTFLKLFFLFLQQESNLLKEGCRLALGWNRAFDVNGYAFLSPHRLAPLSGDLVWECSVSLISR